MAATNPWESFGWNILERRADAFLLWTATDVAAAPVLVLGKLVTSDDEENPYAFTKQLEKPLQQAGGIAGAHLWELNVSDVLQSLPAANAPGNAASPDAVYHYWFQVKNAAYDRTGEVILVTDPFATAVDYRVVQGDRDPTKICQPASVISLDAVRRKLLPCDPSGKLLEVVQSTPATIQAMKRNNELVIYELPVSWTKAESAEKKSRDIGTFRDTLALLKKEEPGTHFASVEVINERALLHELGINALELLPPTDSKFRGEWGYAPAHYFAPDYDLGGEEHNASTDFAALAQHCLDAGIRLINDTVMAFAWDPYIYINFNTFHIQAKRDANHDTEIAINHNPDAWQSSRNHELRDPYGAASWRFLHASNTYNPYDGQQAVITPARAFHKAHLAWWMSKYLLGGLRLDSVNNIGNWDFVREFRADAYAHFKTTYGTNIKAEDYFLVIAEELSMPIGMLYEPAKCVDALWNEEFQRRLRAVIVGQHYGEDGGSDRTEEDRFGWTIKKMINCHELNLWNTDEHFDSGLQAINYITSHDTEGDRKERLWNYLDDWGLTQNGDKAQRCKLAFACLLTSVGIPMIFAGEEFCDEGDRKFVHPDKQEDPINWERVKDLWRAELFQCVSRLVKLRTTSSALTNLVRSSTDFINSDTSRGGRIQAWVRRSVSGDDKVVVVANFSDELFNQGYNVTGWPGKPEGKHWHDVIADVSRDNAGHENLQPWDVKVYELRSD